VALEKMVRDIKGTEDQDRIWVEMQESLGDFWWLRRNSKNWGQGWRYYQKAVEWWAGPLTSNWPVNGTSTSPGTSPVRPGGRLTITMDITAGCVEIALPIESGGTG